MDLKQLLNQTTINSNDTTESTVVAELDKNTEPEPEPDPEPEPEPEQEDKRFLRPWNKLEKGSKMNRILLFVATQKLDKELSDNQSNDLKCLLFKGCENGLFNKVSDVDYDEETGIIDSFKNLEFNESTKKYKLKTGSTKNRSVSKSRSNIDRLTKK